MIYSTPSVYGPFDTRYSFNLSNLGIFFTLYWVLISFSYLYFVLVSMSFFHTLLLVTVSYRLHRKIKFLPKFVVYKSEMFTLYLGFIFEKLMQRNE